MKNNMNGKKQVVIDNLEFFITKTNDLNKSFSGQIVVYELKV